MRAYMSIPGARVVCCVSPTRDGQHAEAEARMLCHASGGQEPATDDNLANVNLYPYMNAKHALAEALAAFCDDGQEARS